MDVNALFCAVVEECSRLFTSSCAGEGLGGTAGGVTIISTQDWAGAWFGT